jgi:hypothetical protein
MKALWRKQKSEDLCAQYWFIQIWRQLSFGNENRTLKEPMSKKRH